jgi:uncharacterized membrane protein YfcA
MNDLASSLLLFASAFLAGGINSLAGGGTLLSYPALLGVGVLPIEANATSTVCLVQGSLAAFWGYRKKLTRDGALLFALAIPSVLGSIVGAVILLHLSQRSFALLVPWLILGATALFVLADRLHRRWKGRPEVAVTGRRLTALLVVQFAVAVYGGFFGAGQGILMLATLGLFGMRDLERMNGLKNFCAAAINSVASVLFICGGRVLWRPALIMAVAAICGGLAGAHWAQRAGQKVARKAIVAIGFAASLYSFYKAFGG